MHLGGPDTITAYSIEDNELWLRHLLGLVLQVGLAFYVFSRSWGGGILPLIAIPMFIVGIIKYSERTWVLWSSCSKSLRNFTLLDFYNSYLSMRNPESDQEREYLRQAYTFFHISKFTMQDLAPSYWDLMLSHLWFSKIPANGFFKVVEVELGLLYDMFYTKAPLIYSCSGIIHRCITFLLSVTAFIIFQVKIEKHAYSSIDVAIMYLLFVAAAFLELYAFLCLVLSDKTMIWLLDKGGKSLTSAIDYRLRKLTTSKRWSRCVSQYNLLRVCTENKQLKCLELVGIDGMMRQMYVSRKELNGGLQEFIFKHLQKKVEKMKENYNLFDKKIENQSIVVWHVATEICYGAEKDDASNASTSKCLSEYMMYLLVIRLNMLSKGFRDEGYLKTLGYQMRYEEVIQSYREAPRYDDAEFRKEWKTNKSEFYGGRVLARPEYKYYSEVSIPKTFLECIGR
ncbi:hypothetical protein DKX38_022445 [Salix brachista]|uniref:DUF4220 domain-containing protein n=1 Tax=Salix brachista TaxID=2182728 RepID=A0A5N5K1E3_9ROSI|nr:hypothetical protein DKX38_022445 [Salix brachista]